MAHSNKTTAFALGARITIGLLSIILAIAAIVISIAITVAAAGGAYLTTATDFTISAPFPTDS